MLRPHARPHGTCRFGLREPGLKMDEHFQVEELLAVFASLPNDLLFCSSILDIPKIELIAFVFVTEMIELVWAPFNPDIKLLVITNPIRSHLVCGCHAAPKPGPTAILQLSWSWLHLEEVPWCSWRRTRRRGAFRCPRRRQQHHAWQPTGDDWIASV